MPKAINPYTGKEIQELAETPAAQVERALCRAAAQASKWTERASVERVAILRDVASLLRARRPALARLITCEMGKLIGEAEAEVEKCATVCDYYAESAPSQLADQPVASDAGRSLVACQPLGVILAVMPWNFPFWQVFRCAAPALAAGNTVLLKHASNVPGCALAIERLFRDASAEEGVFQALLIGPDRTEQLIADRRIAAVSLTGSDTAGRKVAAIAGAHLKKILLELGGSDAFVVLEDADLDIAAATAARSRFLNAGQSCIAAKRFIIAEAIAESFIARFRAAAEALRPGDPLDPETTLAPLARADLRERLHRQVEQSIAAGARALTGATLVDGPGTFYRPTLLVQVRPGMPACDDELFGPVAAIMRVPDEAAALAAANTTRFGLGGSVWTADTARGEQLARRMACGAAFVNGLVKSDPRLPFGGIKDSGYGRELGAAGIREFVNLKTLWIA